MADQDREKQLDRMLDSMLSHYAAAEPRPGLETKVFALIGEFRKQKQGLGRLRWLIAGTGLATAAVAVVVLLLVFRTAQGPRLAPQVAQNGQIQPLAHTGKTVPRQTENNPAKKRALVRKSLPRRILRQADSQAQETALAERPAVFPTPVPLTEQERLLFTYVENTPRSEVVAQIKSDDQKEARAFWAAGEPLLQRKAQ
ncbi:MAG TPA: hypothetical protein VN669_09070 [Candidatus Acidoferrales bacterium]|jgi:hypothetical protein|nr:hypothetical protein [Candidatus Acidoferrales bacterium]